MVIGLNHELPNSGSAWLVCTYSPDGGAGNVGIWPTGGGDCPQAEDKTRLTSLLDGRAWATDTLDTLQERGFTLAHGTWVENYEDEDS